MTRLAKAVGVDARSISGFEKQEFNPSDDTIRRLAIELDFPVSFFFRMKNCRPSTVMQQAFDHSQKCLLHNETWHCFQAH